jgi:hypothetical protein
MSIALILPVEPIFSAHRIQDGDQYSKWRQNGTLAFQHVGSHFRLILGRRFRKCNQFYDLSPSEGVGGKYSKIYDEK